MEKLEGNLIKFVLGLWIVVISSTIFYYQLQDDTSLEESMLYPISIGLGTIVAGIIMYYLIQLHGIIFKKSERERFKQQVQQFLEYCRDKKFLGSSKKRQKFEYSSFCFNGQHKKCKRARRLQRTGELCECDCHDVLNHYQQEALPKLKKFLENSENS